MIFSFFVFSLKTPNMFVVITLTFSFRYITRIVFLLGTLLGLLTSCEDVTRSCTAGCLASLLPALPEEELEPVMNDTVLVDDPSQDMTIRHGRSATLAVLMAQSPATALVHQDKLVKTILSQFGADHVSIVTNGVRSAGYLILDTVTRSIQVFRV